MEKRIKELIFFLSLSLIVSLNLIAQEKNLKEQSLVKIILKLQKQHNIQFNYAEDLIKDISLKPPLKDLSLIDALKYLDTTTGLTFSIMGENFVLVKPKEGLAICGYLYDQNTMLPLSKATVYSLKNFTTSDESGFFQIAITSKFEQITIRHLGYKTINKLYNQFTKNDCGTIYLHPNFQSLSEVIISNYITSGINKINNGSFEINFSKFDILPGLIDNDVLQSVQAFPGIMSINETVSNINIRGGAHDQNLILWDNIKMYQSGHFFGLISMFNPQITQKVSLRKNGSDVTYTDGVSGTIDMQTNRNINTKFKGNIGVNLTDINGFADIPIGRKSSIQVAGRKSISGFLETPTYSEFFDRISQNTEVQTNVNNISNSDEKFDFYDTSLRWIYKISDADELRFNFINVSDELIFNENGIINSIEESRESRLIQNSMAGALYYNRVWNDKLQTTFEAYETDYKLKAANANLIDSQRFLQENVVSETSIKLKADYRLNDRLHLLGGYHFVETKVTNLDDVDNPIFRLLVSEVVRTHAVFSQIGYKSFDRNTHLNLGIRLNYLDKFKKQIVEPRLSFSQRFLENFTFEILGELKHQITSQVINFQNDFLGVEKRRWQLSNNDDIPVITSEQISASINFSNNGWLVSADGYYKNVNGITTQSQGFQNQFEFIKTSGSYGVIGLDLLLRKSIDKFNSWLSYSYMNNDYTFKDLEAYSFPSNYDVSHTITIGTAYTTKNFKVSAGLNWRTGKPTTQPIKGNEIVDNEVNFGSTNNVRLQDYLRVDVSALYNFKLSPKVKANIGLSVWNILNKKNEINNFYRIKESVVNETKQHSLGITPNAVFRFFF
ncbi:TonB-dependent receptor [Yeosuana sp.]|uniref:TonB-dependent receptor n=1 Tax=Yeosuana sp. TaxID=2529388 RepID=UPI0040551C40